MRYACATKINKAIDSVGAHATAWTCTREELRRPRLTPLKRYWMWLKSECDRYGGSGEQRKPSQFSPTSLNIQRVPKSQGLRCLPDGFAGACMASEVADGLRELHVLLVKVFIALGAAARVAGGGRVVQHTSAPRERRVERALEDGRDGELVAGLVRVNGALAVDRVWAVGCGVARGSEGHIDVRADDVVATAALDVPNGL